MAASFIRIAIAQIGTQLGNPDKTLENMSHYVSQAAKQKAQLVVFPEAYIGGYPKGLDFGVTLGIRTAEGRKQFADYAANACTIGDAVFQKIASMAKQSKVHLLTGIVEKEGATLYCSTLLFSPDGELLNHRRKLIPTAQERVLWGQGDGSNLEVIRTKFGNIGSAICWENYMPLLRMALYSQNIQLYCIPTVDDRDAWQFTLRHIAREGRCFVISACQYLPRNYYPEEWIKYISDDLQTPIRGGSCIVNPLGDYIVAPVYDEEALLVAEIDMAEIAEGKFDLDVAGHYNRPDIFNFNWKHA